jgi:hypothetical protein
MSFVYFAGYFKVAALTGRLVPGFILASLPVPQAILTGAYVLRQEFCSQAQAIIRSAAVAVAVAVAIAGIGEDVCALSRNAGLALCHTTRVLQ